MKKQHEPEVEMLEEYDFSGKKGVRGKYYQAYRQGHIVRIDQEDGSATTRYFAPEDRVVLSRRLRFMTTRKAIENAMLVYDSSTAPSNEDIMKLVKQARKTSKTYVLP